MGIVQACSGPVQACLFQFGATLIFAVRFESNRVDMVRSVLARVGVHAVRVGAGSVEKHIVYFFIVFQSVCCV